MTSLKQIVIAAALVTTLSVGLTGFISQGLNAYPDTSTSVDSGELNTLEEIKNMSSIADNAQEDAQNIDPKENFFLLPKIVSTFGFVFEAIPVFEQYLAISISSLGLGSANWFQTLGFIVIVVTVTFTFAKRIRG